MFQFTPAQLHLFRLGGWARQFKTDPPRFHVNCHVTCCISSYTNMTKVNANNDNNQQ